MYCRCPSAKSVSNASELLPEPLGPGDHDQPVARNVEIDVLEVVNASAAQADAIVGFEQSAVPLGACDAVAT